MQKQTWKRLEVQPNKPHQKRDDLIIHKREFSGDPPSPEELTGRPSNELIKFVSCNDTIVGDHIMHGIYGIIPTNELLVFSHNHKAIYWSVVESLLTYPTMEDRVFGIDQLDNQRATMVQEVIFTKYGTELEGK